MEPEKKEYKKNEELKMEDLKHIKDWLSKQPHLPQNIKDEKLILLMHKCHYNLEKSKKFIDKFYTLRTHLPEFFTNRNLSVPEVKEAFECQNVFDLEGRTKQGYKVIYTGFNNPDLNIFNFAECFKIVCMVCDAVIEAEGRSPGYLIIIDMKLTKLGHITRLSLPVMKKIITYVQEAAPFRMKGIHMIGSVSFVDKVLALASPFINSKLMNKLKVHTKGSDSIYEFVPLEMFPNEYGGKGGTLENHRERMFKRVQDFETWYKEDELMRVNEAKRPGKSMSPGYLFGVDGSFKKLTID